MTVHQTFLRQPEGVSHVPQFPGERGDGFHANDPAAPDVWRCGGCDTVRPTEVCYCPECGGTTASYLDRQNTESMLWLGAVWPEYVA